MSVLGRIGLGPDGSGGELEIVIVNHDPKVTSTDALTGSLIIRSDTGEHFRKLDDGDTTAVTDPISLKNNDTNVDPTVNNDETQDYNVFSFWHNSTNSSVFVCTDASTGAAVWKSTTLPDTIINLQPFADGSIVETIDLVIAQNGANVEVRLQAEGGGDLTVQLNEVNYLFEATPIVPYNLDVGTDTDPTLNYVWLEESGGFAVLAHNTTGFPATAHAPIAEVFVQSAAGVGTDGALKVHAWTDHTGGSGDGTGHLGHINKRLRRQNAKWLSDMSPVLSITGAGTIVDVSTTEGSAFQLHEHVMPARNTFTGDPFWVVNDFTTKYLKETNLEALLTDSNNVSMVDKYYPLVLWVVVSEKQADCKLMINLPSGSYDNATDLVNDPKGYADYTIPAEFEGTGVLVGLLQLSHESGGGTFTEINTVKLVGRVPDNIAGIIQGMVDYSDALFRIFNNLDPTKEISFDAAAVSAATVRKIIMPDRDILLDYKSILLDAEAMDDPNNTDWNNFPTIDLARKSKDTLNAGLTVRRFDDTDEEGVGISVWIPAGATNLRMRFLHRSQAGVGDGAAGDATAELTLYARSAPLAGGTITAWSAGTNLTAFNFLLADTTDWQYDEETIDIDTFGLVANAWNQIELTRDVLADNLSGDYVLRSMMLEFS
jgi:hypothetical protein